MWQAPYSARHQTQPHRPRKLTYAITIVALLLAFLLVRWMERYFTPTPATLFLCAILFSALWGGLGPALLSVVASILIFDFFYILPQHSFAIEIKEIPRILIFSLTAIFVGALGAAQNLSIKSLRDAYAKLAGAIKALKLTNQALEHDNAERKRIHEQLRYSEALLNEGQKISQTGSWRWSIASGELIWSDEHYRIFGYERSESPTTFAMFSERVHPEDVDGVRQIANAAVQRRDRFECEYRIVLPDGAIRHLRGVGRPISPAPLDADEYIGITVDVTARRQTEEQLKESQRLLRQLADRSETEREEERKHLARELHDDLAQYLSALRMRISILNMEFGQQLPGLQTEVQGMVSLVDATIQMTRNAITALRPVALDMGIVSALKWLTSEFVAKTNIRCTLHIGVSDNALRDHSATTVFRVVQESLRNIGKHAAADEVDIRFERRGDHYVLLVRDNGVGFDPTVKKDKTFGLLGIQERVLMLDGTVDIRTAPNHGTEIEVSIPVLSTMRDPAMHP
jgi:signal transduction histidine kinase